MALKLRILLHLPLLATSLSCERESPPQRDTTEMIDRATNGYKLTHSLDRTRDHTRTAEPPHALDVDEKIAQALAASTPSERYRLLCDLINCADAERLVDLYRAAEEALDAGQAADLQNKCIGRLAKEDPALGWGLFGELSPGQSRQTLLATFFSSLSLSDWRLATEWFADLPFDEDSKTVSGALVRSFSDSVPSKISLVLHEVAQKSPIAAILERALGKAAAEQKMSISDLNSLVDTYDPLGTSSVRATWIAYRSREADKEFVEQFMSADVSQDLRDRMLPTVAGNYAINDPHSALEWVFSLRESEASLAAASIATQQWLIRDSGDAGEWLAAQRPSEQRDRAVTEVVKYLVSKQAIKEAEEWIAFLDSEDARRNAGALLPQK